MVLRARDIMRSELFFVDGRTTAHEAARAMAERHLGYALVTESDKPVGIVTEWDFLSKVVGAGRDPQTVPVRAIATSPLISADASTPTEEIVAVMDQRGIRRMVLTENDRIVGIVTSREVLHSFRQYVDRVSADISRMHPTAP